MMHVEATDALAPPALKNQRHGRRAGREKLDLRSGRLHRTRY